MTTAEVINELNRREVYYTLTKITDDYLNFVVKQFVWASSVEVNLRDMTIKEVHGLGSHVRIRVYDKEKDEDIIEDIASRVKNFGRIGAIIYEPIVTPKPSHIITSTTNYFLFNKH